LVFSDEKEGSWSLDDVKDTSLLLPVVELKYASKEGFRGSRRVHTNEVRAVPFLCEIVDLFCEREGRETHGFVFFQFAWAGYEFFYSCFPDLCVALERCTREPHMEVFD
jgi:hypothetical protein